MIVNVAGSGRPIDIPLDEAFACLFSSWFSCLRMFLPVRLDIRGFLLLILLLDSAALLIELAEIDLN